MVTEHLQCLPAESQANSSGAHPLMSILPGIAPVHYSRQVFRSDANAAVFHTEFRFTFIGEIDVYSARRSVFGCIGEDLFQCK